MINPLEPIMLQGLSDQEARERLAVDGYNELPSAKKRTIFHILLEVVSEPMFLMLIACGVRSGRSPDADGFRGRHHRHHVLPGA
jgi:magnesium-transporting ATPase (P-type)